MATVRESIQSKINTLGIGVVDHLHNISITNTTQEQSAQVILKEPKIYKSIFCLDNLGIDKSLKSIIVEVKDSVLRLYYLLDSSCFFIDFECNYQTLELVKELPIELIHYLRILCSKKGQVELAVREDILFILFEDTFPSKMPMKERKEKEVNKYVLSIPLKEISELDKEVVEFSYNLVYYGRGCKTTPIGQDIPNLPINLSTIICPYHKEPIEYWGTTTYTDSGEFTVVDTSGLPISLVICPTLVSKNFEISNVTNIESGMELDYSSNIEEDIQDLDDNVSLVDGFMLGEQYE